MLLSEFYANAHSDDTLNKRSPKTHVVLSPAAHSSHLVPISHYNISYLSSKYGINCVIHPFNDHYQAWSAIINNNKFTESVLIFNFSFVFPYEKVLGVVFF